MFVMVKTVQKVYFASLLPLSLHLQVIILQPSYSNSTKPIILHMLGLYMVNIGLFVKLWYFGCNNFEDMVMTALSKKCFLWWFSSTDMDKEATQGNFKQFEDEIV